MAGDVTKVAVNSAGAYVYLFDLVKAARVAAGQPPLPTSAARRLTFITDADMRITTDPVPAPLGVLIQTGVEHFQESGIGPAGEDIRKWYVKGVGNMDVMQEY